MDYRIPQYEIRIYLHKNEYSSFQNKEYVFPKLRFQDAAVQWLSNAADYFLVDKIKNTC